jgi:hypothetical protein
VTVNGDLVNLSADLGSDALAACATMDFKVVFSYALPLRVRTCLVMPVDKALILTTVGGPDISTSSTSKPPAETRRWCA